MDRNKIQEVHILVDDKHPESEFAPYITAAGLNDLFLDDPSTHVIAMTVKTPGAVQINDDIENKVFSEVYVIIERDRDSSEMD